MKPSHPSWSPRFVALFAGVALVAAPALAWADPPAAPAPAPTPPAKAVTPAAPAKAPAKAPPAAPAAATSGDYAYFFDTDSLAGAGLAASSASITVRPVLRGSLLIRPRVEFVSELVKSVENL